MSQGKVNLTVVRLPDRIRLLLYAFRSRWSYRCRLWKQKNPQPSINSVFRGLCSPGGGVSTLLTLSISPVNQWKQDICILVHLFLLLFYPRNFLLCSHDALFLRVHQHHLKNQLMNKYFLHLSALSNQNHHWSSHEPSLLFSSAFRNPETLLVLCHRANKGNT